MLHPDYIPINEIILKSEKESGNLLILKEHALAMHQKIPILVELRLLKKSLSLDQLNTLKDFIRTATF